MANSFVQGLIDRLIARAARLSSEAEDPNRTKRVLARGTVEDAEAAAAARARDAWTRGDVAKAVEEIELFADYSSKPETLVLHGEMLMAAGTVDRAKQVLERGLRATPGHPGLLEALAELHQHLGNSSEEFRLRMRRLKASSRYAPRQVVDAMGAMMRASSKQPMVKGDLVLLLKLFEQVEPIASREERLEFAEWLFTIKRTRDRALALAEANTPALPGSAIRTLQWTTLEQLRESQTLAQHEQADDLLPGTSLRTAQLADAGVLAGVQFTPTLPRAQQVLQGFVTRRWITSREQPGSQLVMQNMWELLVRQSEAPPRRIEETAVLVGSDPDFFRFVTDHLSRLATLAAMGLAPEDPLWVVGEAMPAYQVEFLRLAGLRTDRLLPVGPSDSVEFAHLIAPYPLARNGRQLSPLVAKWARETLTAAAGATDGAASRRVYISQPGRIANEAELLSWLKGEGFDCVEPQQMDVGQLLRLFAQARELIAPAGGALANMVFMPAGGRVTALYNADLPASAESLAIDYLARASGHRFAAAAGAPLAVGDAAYAVPLAVLQEALEKV